eukprot:TRINITY_DN6696_c0_g1_i1.p1 TRINITY_DN6696_c0_g1~~TRINITY_DN6696_c0_g1_i1.p1  ORF type:complete len:751 (-),score=209.79 TRINITY_DN6696_c0_g1_i1:29-2281(-)
MPVSMDPDVSSPGVSSPSIFPMKQEPGAADFTLPNNFDISDLSQIHALLAQATAREKEIDLELESVLSKSLSKGGLKDVVEKVDTFDTTIPSKLHPIVRQAKDLSKTIQQTTLLAETISKKVRDLDTTRARVKETLNKVTDIIDLSQCIEGVQQAIQKEDYETAASHIQKYLRLDVSQVLEASSAQLLRNAEGQLKTLVRTKLDTALAQDKEDDILRFCKLYIPLGQKEEGLTRYCHHLRKVCSMEADVNHRRLLKSMGKSASAAASLAPGEAPITSVAALTQLFENVAGLLENQFPLVLTHFGEGAQEAVLKNLQAQCDAHSSKILDLFLDEHAVARRAQDVAIANRVPPSEREYDKHVIRIDPRELATVLDEMVGLSKAAEFYERFVKRKATVAGCAAPLTELNRRMQELLGQYVLLEEYFMVESVDKAIKMDETQGDSQTSSMVDYVFFVLQKSTSRAVDSASMGAVCAVINHTNTCLNRDYKEVLQRVFREAVFRAQAAKASERKYDHLVTLNNMEISAEYIVKLRKDLEARCIRLFGNNEENPSMVSTCLADLNDTSTGFKNMLSENMAQFSDSLVPRVRGLLDTFGAAQVTYDLTETDYRHNEINDPWAQHFINDVSIFLRPFATHLTATNYDYLVHLILATLVRRMEQMLMAKKVSQFGALQFDKDVRALLQYFSSITQRPVRDKFTRLSQMASLLSLERTDEVAEYYAEHQAGAVWRLSQTEVRKVLALRTDFSPEAIARIK